MNSYLDLEGSFESGQGGLAKLAPAVQGRVKSILVRDGEKVVKGQLLVRLDPSVQSAQANSARAALEAAQMQIQQSQTSYSASQADQANSLLAAKVALEQAKAEGENTIAQARFTYDQAEADLLRLKNGARPLEIAQAHEATIQAQATVARDQTEFDRDQELWPQGYIAKRQLDDAKTALETAKSVLNAAEDSERLVRSGARPEELASATAKASAAEEALASARKVAKYQLAAAQSAYDHAKSGTLQVRLKQQDIANSKVLAAQKGADLAAAQATSGLLEIRAPFDGKIVKRSVAPGELADPNNPILIEQKMGGTIDFAATGLPDQVNQIHPGMEAEIASGSGSLQGRVLSISAPEATGNLSTVRIAVEGAAVSGSFGTAHVLLKKLPDALVVPDTCLVQKDGKEVVFRDVDGTAKLTAVTLGPESNGSAVILSGLKLGDSVVASGGNELDDGAKIQDAAADKEKGKADPDDKKDPTP